MEKKQKSKELGQKPLKTEEFDDALDKLLKPHKKERTRPK